MLPLALPLVCAIDDTKLSYALDTADYRTTARTFNLSARYPCVTGLKVTSTDGKRPV